VSIQLDLSLRPVKACRILSKKVPDVIDLPIGSR